MELHAYIFFQGNCQEALNFYAQALHGEIVEFHAYNENPEIAKSLPAEWHDKWMHAAFKAGEIFFMAADVPPAKIGEYGAEVNYPTSPITLSLNFTSEEQEIEVFNQLATDGKVTMPLTDTFWGAKFGMLTDKFGIKWMFNYDRPQA